MCTLRLLRPWLVALLMMGSGCDVNSKAPEASTPPASEEITTRTEPIPPETEDLAVADPSPSEPVTAAMKLLPSNTTAGSTVELLVAVRIARGHYLHAQDEPGSHFTPLGVDVTLPAGVTAIGDWKFPTPEKGRGDRQIYRNEMLLKRSLQVAPTVPPQTLDIVAKLRCQACNEDLCWPPKKMALSAPLVIRSQPR